MHGDFVTTPPRRVDPRAKLSRERVVETAQEILAQEGIASLTMRRLASELEVAPMTLYTYVRDKDDLLGAVVEAIVREFPMPPAEGSWRSQMRTLMRTLHRVLLANPFIVQLRLRGPLASRRQLGFNEAGLRILMDAGFDKVEAARAYRGLLVLTFGFAAFGPPADSHDHERTVDAALAALPRDEFPYLVAAGPETVATHAPGTALYDYVLERTLDGIESRSDPTTRPGA
jgi:AcrR family transcriptional regulator